MNLTDKIDRFFDTHSGEELAAMYDDLKLGELANIPDIKLLPDDDPLEFLQEMADYREKTKDVSVGEY